MIGGGDDMRHVNVRVAGVDLGERLLRGSFQPVVEFLRHPVPQLVEERLDVKSGHEHAEKPGDAAQLVEVADQRVARPRVLDLDGDLPPVLPDAAVHLPDGGRGRRLIIELGEAGPPVLAHIGGQDLVNGTRGQRRRGLLQPGQRCPVRPGDLRGQRRLED